MTAPFDLTLRAVRPATSQLSRAQVGTLRLLLLADKEARIADVARHAATLAALGRDLPAGTTSLDRAITALHMYGAREAIEEVDDALARMEHYGYGTCLSCGRPIPFEHLEVVPRERFCPACPDRAVPPLIGRRRVVRNAAPS
jgi:RNA polymerase-binding transcription factor DksA